MNLTKLTAKNPQTQESKTWLFHQGAHPLRRVWCYFSSMKQIAELRTYLSRFFQAEMLQPQEMLILDLFDDAGNSWKITREKEQVTIHKNDTVFRKSQGLNEAIGSFLEACEFPKLKDFSTFTNHYNIQKNDTAIVAQPIQEVSAETKSVSNFLSKRFQEVRSNLEKCMGEEVPDLEKLTQIKLKLEPLYHQYRVLNKQYQEMPKNQQEISLNELAMTIDLLKEELMIMHQMRHLVLSLPSPMQLDSYVKTLGEVERKIESNLSFLKLERIPFELELKNWDVPLEKLTTLKSLEKISIFMQERIRESMEIFSPLYNSYMASVEDLFNSDGTLFKELQNFIETLTKHHEIIEKNSIATENIKLMNKSWFEKIKSNPDKPNPQIMQEKNNRESEIRSINAIFTSIEEVFQKFAETKEKINHCYQNTDASKTELEQHGKSLIKSCESVQESWVRIAQEFSLPEALNLEDYANYRLKFLEIFMCAKHAKILEETIADVTTKVQFVKELIENWQKRTGSQKVFHLASMTSILSEAKNIVRYMEEKEKKLKTCLDNYSETRISQQLRNNLETRAKKLVSIWKKAFQDENLAPMSIKDPKTGYVFEEINILQKLQDWKQVLQEGCLPFVGGLAGVEPKLLTWTLQAQLFNNIEKDKLVQLLNRLENQVFHFIFTDDPEFFGMLKKTPVGQIFFHNQEKAKEMRASPLPKSVLEMIPSKKESTSVLASMVGNSGKNDSMPPFIIKSKKENEPSINQKAKNVLELLNKVKRT